LAASLGVDPREVDLAIRLMRTGRTDLITKVTTGRLTIRQALQSAARISARQPGRELFTEGVKEALATDD
jgi:hypothetical protein